MLLIILVVLFLLCCVLLVFIILIQPSPGEGLGALGGIGTESFFGTKAYKQISKITIALAIAFLVLSILINFSVSHRVKQPAEKVKVETSK